MHRLRSRLRVKATLCTKSFAPPGLPEAFDHEQQLTNHILLGDHAINIVAGRAYISSIAIRPLLTSMVTPSSGNGDLLSTATSRFDALRERGQLFWEESTPQYVEHEGFRFEFRIVPAFGSKPLPPKDSKQTAKGKDPFTDPEEGFVLRYVGDTHVLQFNKFCVFRPQMILHTKEFAKQTEDLDFADFAAGLDVLKQLKEPWVLFYNCGLRAGSSQGHKHCQLIPKPRAEDFVLFPDGMNKELGFGRPVHPPEELHVPYDCLVAPLRFDTSAQDLYELYQNMLGNLRKATRVMSGEHVSGAHNLIMTLDWLCIIPRQSRGENGIYTNAMGMLGLVWVKDQAEREGWNKLHLTDELKAMGAPKLGFPENSRTGS